MSKLYREEHPLLREESDEELQICNSSPKFQRRVRYLTPGRARIQAKGAAAIVTHWPDHLSTLLTYWWIGLAMIGVLIFIIYNSIVAVAVLPPMHPKSSNFQNIEHNIKIKDTNNQSLAPNIYMHMIVNNYEELNMNDYIPYVETFSIKYSHFKYNLIILVNDASKESIDNLSDELKNELALNSLWVENNNNFKKKLNKHTTIQVIPLSKYMDKSPLKKYWRRLPEQFFGFLSRCISIWDKGSIAFNPIILTPKSPNPIYVEKLEHILSDVKWKESRTHNRKKIPKKPRKTVNNIQDIIENLQNDSKTNHIEENMLEVEDKENVFKMEFPPINKVKRNIKSQNKNKKVNIQKLQEIKSVTDRTNEKGSFQYISSLTSDENEVKIIEDITTKQSLLPMFIEYLFHNHDLKNITKNSEDQSVILNGTQIKKYTSKNNEKDQKITSKDPNVVVVGSNISKFGTPLMKNEKSKNNIQNINQLTIDLEGNLIATETPCHAFIGTIFSNTIHHTDEESTKDFIIKELSIFCKGVLSSCKGIEVILL